VDHHELSALAPRLLRSFVQPVRGMIRMQGTPNQSATGSPAYVGRTGGIRILFVEDDEGYRANLVAELSERGFVVHSFTDATWLLRSLDSAVEADAPP
jgi:hypothetical protein